MNAIIDEKKVPENLLGKLNETSVNSSHELLNKNLNKDGYLFLKNVVASKEVELARNEVFKKLYEINEIKDPYNEGIFSGKSDRDVFYNDRGDFWKDVSELDSVRNITNGKILHSIFDKIFGSPSIGFDFIFLRPVANGKSTKMHCDSGFFTRKTKKVLTCWFVFTEISLDRGPLFIIENSHKFEDLKNQYLDFDVAIHKDRKAMINVDPIEFAKQRDSKILTAHFKPGDALIFGMYTLHGTFQNHAIDNKIRLTCDIRYQPKSEEKDPRYFGSNPGGTTGAGYGELNSARPLNEDWHNR